MRAFLFMIALFGLAACATGANTSSGVSVGEIRDAHSITVSESPCFGQCPIYELTAYADDSYELDGQRFTRINGMSEGRLNSGAFAQMVGILESGGFRSLPGDVTYNNPELCPGPPLSDLPSITITLRDRSGEHTVEWYQGCNNATLRDIRDGLRGAFGHDEIVRPG